jgi:hypothetical protein
MQEEEVDTHLHAVRHLPHLQHVRAAAAAGAQQPRRQERAVHCERHRRLADRASSAGGDSAGEGGRLHKGRRPPAHALADAGAARARHRRRRRCLARTHRLQQRGALRAHPHAAVVRSRAVPHRFHSQGRGPAAAEEAAQQAAQDTLSQEAPAAALAPAALAPPAAAAALSPSLQLRSRRLRRRRLSLPQRRLPQFHRTRRLCLRVRFGVSPDDASHGAPLRSQVALLADGRVVVVGLRDRAVALPPAGGGGHTGSGAKEGTKCTTGCAVLYSEHAVLIRLRQT